MRGKKPKKRKKGIGIILTSPKKIGSGSPPRGRNHESTLAVFTDRGTATRSIRSRSGGGGSGRTGGEERSVGTQKRREGGTWGIREQSQPIQNEKKNPAKGPGARGETKREGEGLWDGKWKKEKKKEGKRAVKTKESKRIGKKTTLRGGKKKKIAFGSVGKQTFDRPIVWEIFNRFIGNKQNCPASEGKGITGKGEGVG